MGGEGSWGSVSGLDCHGHVEAEMIAWPLLTVRTLSWVLFWFLILIGILCNCWCQVCGLECPRTSATQVWFHRTTESLWFLDDGAGCRAAGDTALWSLHVCRVGIRKQCHSHTLMSAFAHSLTHSLVNHLPCLLCYFSWLFECLEELMLAGEINRLAELCWVGDVLCREVCWLGCSVTMSLWMCCVV